MGDLRLDDLGSLHCLDSNLGSCGSAALDIPAHNVAHLQGSLLSPCPFALALCHSHSSSHAALKLPACVTFAALNSRTLFNTPRTKHDNIAIDVSNLGSLLNLTALPKCQFESR